MKSKGPEPLRVSKPLEAAILSLLKVFITQSLLPTLASGPCLQAALELGLSGVVLVAMAPPAFCLHKLDLV